LNLNFLRNRLNWTFYEFINSEDHSKSITYKNSEENKLK
jgi:hypothetical protein